MALSSREKGHAICPPDFLNPTQFRKTTKRKPEEEIKNNFFRSSQRKPNKAVHTQLTHTNTICLGRAVALLLLEGEEEEKKKNSHQSVSERTPGKVLFFESKLRRKKVDPARLLFPKGLSHSILPILEA